MSFATGWLDQRALFPAFISEKPEPETGIIIVIPSCGETNPEFVLSSLAECYIPSCKAEVIIVVNAASNATSKIIEQNANYLVELDKWKKDNPEVFFSLHFFDTGPQPSGTWGVGMARRCGMDEALRRFNTINNPDGIIVNLDADCRVAPDYFTSIECDFLRNPKCNGCSIRFEHPLEGNKYPYIYYNSIIKYELHLRCLVKGIKWAGLPFPYHTVGSAMGVRASAYLRAGGMNRRQAGEDFYFIQKLVMMGGFFNLNSTTVYPAPRASERVPFGTGATISRLTKSDNNELLSYNFDAYCELKEIHERIPELFLTGPNDYEKFYQLTPPGFRSFVQLSTWKEKISEIKANVSGSDAFEKRYYDWFNMFRFVKYMNHVHKTVFKMVPVLETAVRLIEESGAMNVPDNERDILFYYRLNEISGN